MKPPSVKKLSVLLAGAVLLCHGIFGTLHLVCDPLSGAPAEPSIEQSTRPRLARVTPTSTPQVIVYVPCTSPSSPSVCSA